MSTEDLSDDEKKYFDTGEVSDKLVEDNKAPETPNVETPVVEAPKLVPEQVPQETDEGDDEVPEGAPEVSTPEQKQRRRFSRKEFESERQARLAAEKQLNDDRVRAARVEERLALLQQALQEPAQPEQKGPVRPDPEQDIFGYTRWLEEQLNSVTTKVNTYEEQIQTGQAEMDNERRYFESLNAFAATKQDFVPAYNYLLRSRAAELVARSYQVTQEQIQGIMDGKVRIPQQVADSLRQEERELYRGAFESGRDPAATIYQYATMRGYRAPAAAPVQSGTPGTPLGGAPAAPAQPAPARSGAPTATDVINQIQKGQSASASLSKAGGTAPDTQLTPEILANMSEDEFERLYEELSASGNKEKLMQIFGH